MSMSEPNSHLSTPDKGGIRFPSGHILVHERWRRDAVCKELSKLVKVSYTDAMGFVDFYITEDCPVIYFSESDLKTNKKECKEKISKLHSVTKGKGLVVTTWNAKLVTDFSDIQEYAALDHGLSVIPISCQSELSTVLQKLMMHEIKSPLKSKKGLRMEPTLDEQVALLTNTPGIGEKEAKILLQRFGNITSICEASKEELKDAVGGKLAAQIFQFFNQPIT